MRPTALATTWLVVFAALTLLSRSSIDAPSGAAPGAFSEARAFDTLTQLTDNGIPHPSGTAANTRMRDRVVDALKTAGYATEIQSTIACGPSDRNPGCTAVENIIAVHKGTSSGKAVLALSHYDSTPAGAGVGDDGAGVAVMVELARHVKTLQTRNDIIFLITDGEETGLRGAIAFATEHPLMMNVGVVVNVEARGASGRSMMFETGDGNAKLIDIYADVVPRPAANSLTYEVYKRLPNDTDFSVFRRAGLSGFNLAFTGSASLYHSARDSVNTLDRRTLQHQGEQAFALTLALADADLSQLTAPSSRASQGNATYFDVFGRWLIHWSSSANLPVASLALVGVLALIVRHRRVFTIRNTAWSLVAIVAVPVLLYGVGFALSYPLGIWPGVHPLDHPAPWPGRIATLLSVWLVVLPVARILRTRADARAAALITWLLFAALALVVVTTVTGAAYVLLVPVVAFVMVAAVETMLGRDSLAWATSAGAFMFAFLLIGLVLALEVTLGFGMTHYKVLALAPVAMTLLPALINQSQSQPHSRHAWWLELGVAVVVVACATVAMRTPAYTADHPRGFNFTLHDNPGETPVWQVSFVGEADREWLSSARFSETPQSLRQYGEINGSGFLRLSNDGHLPPPTFTVTRNEVDATQDTLRVMTATLRTSRGGSGLGLVVPAGQGIRSIRVSGHEVLPVMPRTRPVFLRFSGFVDRDLPLEITFDPQQAESITIVERGPLPDTHEARALTTIRPATAAAVHLGDAAVVSARISLR